MIFIIMLYPKIELQSFFRNAEPVTGLPWTGHIMMTIMSSWALYLIFTDCVYTRAEFAQKGLLGAVWLLSINLLPADHHEERVILDELGMRI